MKHPSSSVLQDDVTITDIINGTAASAAMSASAAASSTASTGSAASGSERGIDVGRVGSWATDFEKLLRDPLGLQTFTVGMINIAWGNHKIV